MVTSMTGYHSGEVLPCPNPTNPPPAASSDFKMPHFTTAISHRTRLEADIRQHPTDTGLVKRFVTDWAGPRAVPRGRSNSASERLRYAYDNAGRSPAR